MCVFIAYLSWVLIMIKPPVMVYLVEDMLVVVVVAVAAAIVVVGDLTLARCRDLGWVH